MLTILLPSVKNGSRTTSMTILSFMEVRNNGSDTIEAEREGVIKDAVKDSAKRGTTFDTTQYKWVQEDI